MAPIPIIWNTLRRPVASSLLSRRVGCPKRLYSDAPEPFPKSAFTKPPEPRPLESYGGFWKRYTGDPEIGDYPYVKWESTQLRDPNAVYWDKFDRRHKGEMLHEEDEILGMGLQDWHRIPVKDAAMRLGVFFAFCGSLFATVYFLVRPEENRPATKTLYPFDGLRLELGGDPNDPSDRGFAAPSGTDPKYLP